jgi:peroxiredoxin Q/BCP
VQLRLAYQQFVERQAEVIVVGPEGSAAFKRYWTAHKLPFIGLPDPKGQVLKRFGQEVNLFKLGRMPAQAIVSKEGIVQWAHYGKSMMDIPDNEQLLGLLDRVNSPQQE